MFLEFVRKELSGAIRQPMLYVFILLFALLAGLGVGSESVTIGGSVGNIYKNSPHEITMYTLFLSFFGLLFAAAFFNNAALRDYNNHFHEILFSTPINKQGYFFGRFIGALILSTLPFLGIYLGFFLGTLLGPALGDLSPDRIGPYNPMAIINNYLLFVIPNMFFAGTIIFALAQRFKSTVISFVGALGIIVLYIISSTLMSDIENETTAALVDVFGIKAYSVVSQYYTPIEKNTLYPQPAGLILYNRLIWIALGILILVGTYFSFSFIKKDKKVKSSTKSVAYKGSKGTFITKPEVQNYFNWKTQWLQFKSFFFINFMSIMKSITFKILFLFCLILVTVEIVQGFEYYGLQSYPVTYIMLGNIDGMAGLFVFIIIVFFSGELIWRDRMQKINEVIDATPHNSINSLIAKHLSLLTLVGALYFFFILISIGYQLINGYTNLELGLYLSNFFIDFIGIFITWSGVNIFLQVIINNRYIAYFASILLFFVQVFFWDILDINSNMVQIASYPSLVYSDMNGYGPGLTGAIWFQVYWVLFSLLLVLIAGLFWNRGTTSSFLSKFKTIRKKLSPSYSIAIATFSVVWISTAGFVYYNTQILNTYNTSDENEQEQLDYEKKYKKYEKVAQPKLTQATYHIDIYPEERNVDVKAELMIKNYTRKPIDSLHYTINENWNHILEIPNSEEVYNDKDLGYLIYKLNQPLQPGDSIPIVVNANYETKGFTNGIGNTSVVKNGTFFNNLSILPSFGYNSGIEISDKHKRKKFDLPRKIRMPKLQKECNDHCHDNYLTQGVSDWVNVETYISTSSDQMAIAPGSLLKEWKENGRNHYHYKVDHPSQNFYSFISANFEVQRKKWNGVDIEVYYTAKHDYNISKIISAVERSLAYYSKNFGPYYHKQARVIEFPRYANFAQAFPGTMPYSESFGFIINLEDESENNVIDAVIAHEMAHQWWAHQEVAANMQGGTMITESFAEYSSLMVMKSVTDRLKMKDFLKYDHNRYLRGRSRESEKELPLYKVENQQYIHYGKGSVILYALQDYIGEEKVNNALKEFLNEFKYAKPPYPTSLDFLAHLEKEVPDSLSYLIQDWFKEITLYDNRLIEASYKPLDNGKYQVKLQIEAHKIKADTIGEEKTLAPNDWIDVGIYADKEEKKLIYEKRMKFSEENFTLTFDVDTIPSKAAIDPRRILIERVYKDNTKSLTEEE